ncbi:hypothetical protein B0H17DRAFT_292890 [Mycena rosella]|uniref:Uncharacterized protein n=1 Tax=Mycena rosella TaxID=1033263 RepID=A0AAD7CUX3_MYCRO|nr:hypothetical protein B0H17DRAFT_292890 [Mycena rosella]
MTSAVILYVVLVALCVLVFMGGCLCCGCCHTRVYYQRHMQTLVAMNDQSGRDWGPEPGLFDVYLYPPGEKREADSDWQNIMPISVSLGGLDAAGAPSTAQISVTISMPSPQPFEAPEPSLDDECYLPPLEIGISNIEVLSVDANALRFSVGPSSLEPDGPTSRKRES